MLCGEDAPGGFQAVHLRHPDVHEYHVGTVLEHRRDRLGAVCGLGDDRDAGLGQDQPEAEPHQLLVIGDQHARRGLARPVIGRLTGVGGACRGTSGSLS
jgi:hypothetical protein